MASKDPSKGVALLSSLRNAQTTCSQLSEHLEAASADLERVLSTFESEVTRAEAAVQSLSSQLVRAQAAARLTPEASTPETRSGIELRQTIARIQRENQHQQRCERALRFIMDVMHQREDEVPHDPLQQALKHASWHYQSYRRAPTLDKMDNKFTAPPTTEEVLDALEAWMKTSTFGVKERLRAR